MRVLLVYTNQTRDLLPAPPIGLSYVASATRRAGHTVRFLDLLVSRDPVGDLDQAIKEFHPQVLGLSVRNIDNVVHQRLNRHLGLLQQLIAQIRTRSQAPIVLGGPAISILGPESLKHLQADYALLGEGETSFPALLAALESGKQVATIPGLCYRHGQAVLHTPPLRYPRFGASGMEQWIDWQAYEARGGTWAIQTKRGCPMTCTYCTYPAVEGEGMRRRPVGEIVDEMEEVMARVKPRCFEFVDSTFNLPPDHAIDLCREIIRRKLKVNLTAMGVNPLTVSEELFTLMRRAGFNSMMITPEVANDSMLRNLRKGFALKHVRRAAELARASGLHSMWFFMLGGPGETRETVEETVAFVEQHLNWKRCLAMFMTGIRILPGTELACSALQQGYLPAQTDLAQPVFYFSPQVEEAWILDRINRAVAQRMNIVHAAEEGGSAYERLVYKALYWLGVAPPYWRFLPYMLSVPPLPALRRRYPAVSGARLKIRGRRTQRDA